MGDVSAAAEREVGETVATLKRGAEDLEDELRGSNGLVSVVSKAARLLGDALFAVRSITARIREPELEYDDAEEEDEPDGAFSDDEENETLEAELPPPPAPVPAPLVPDLREVTVVGLDHKEPAMFQGVRGATPMKPYFCSGDVKNHNPRIMHGEHEMVIKFANFTDSTPSKKFRRLGKWIFKTFLEWSRGKFVMRGLNQDPTPTTVRVQVGLPRGAKKKEVVKCLKAHRPTGMTKDTWDVRIFFGDRASNAGGRGVNAGHTGFALLMHELGHTLRLGHSGKFLRGKASASGARAYLDVWNSKTSYADGLCAMGGNGIGGGYCIPALHRLGWVEEHEVQYVEPGKTFRLRRRHFRDEVSAVALVFNDPLTGARFWWNWERIAQASDKWGMGSFDLPDELDGGPAKGFFVKYVSGLYNTSKMVRHFRLSLHGAAWVDDSGLVFETQVVDMDHVDVRVTFDAAKVARALPLEVTGVQQTVATPAVAPGTPGKVSLAITVHNPNPPTTSPAVLGARRSIFTGGDEFACPNKVRFFIVGGASITYDFIVDSKASPLLQADVVDVPATLVLGEAFTHSFLVNFAPPPSAAT